MQGNAQMGEEHGLEGTEGCPEDGAVTRCERSWGGGEGHGGHGPKGHRMDFCHILRVRASPWIVDPAEW